MGKEAKTNAMRMLERARIHYTAHEYPHQEGAAVDGATVAGVYFLHATETYEEEDK